MERRILDLEKQNTELIAKNQFFMSKWEEAQNQAALMRAQVEEKKNENMLLIGQIKQLENNRTQQEVAIHALRQQLSELSDVNKNLNYNLNRGQVNNKENVESIKALYRENEMVKKRKDELSDINRSLMRDIEAKDEEIMEREKHFRDVMENFKALANELATTRTAFGDSEQACQELQQTIASQAEQIAQLQVCLYLMHKYFLFIFLFNFFTKILIQDRLREFEHANTTLGSALQQHHSHSQQLTQEVINARNEIERERDEINQLFSEQQAHLLVSQSQSERMKEQEREIAQLMSENMRLKNRCEELNAQTVAAEQISEGESQKVVGVHQLLIEAQADCAEQQGRIDALMNEIAAKNIDLQEMEKKNIQKEKQVTKYVEEQMNHMQEANELRRQLSHAIQERDDIVGKGGNMRMEYKQMEATVSHLRKALEQSQKDLANSIEEVEKLKQNQQLMKTSLQSTYERRIGDLETDIETLRFKYKQLSSDYTRLQECNSLGNNNIDKENEIKKEINQNKQVFIPQTQQSSYISHHQTHSTSPSFTIQSAFHPDTHSNIQHYQSSSTQQYKPSSQSQQYNKNDEKLDSPTFGLLNSIIPNGPSQQSSNQNLNITNKKKNESKEGKVTIPAHWVLNGGKD